MRRYGLRCWPLSEVPPRKVGCAFTSEAIDGLYRTDPRAILHTR